MARASILFAHLFLIAAMATATAEDSGFLLNFGLNVKLPDEIHSYSVQSHGIHLSRGQAFHGSGLGNFDYFLTVTDIEDAKGRLTIEIYEFATPKKESDVISEIVSDIDFSLNSSTVFESMTDTFRVELAFSIIEE